MPLAVNTILLGLAVYPTYLVVRDHVPDVTDKFAEVAVSSERTSDEESLKTTQVSVPDAEKGAIAQNIAPAGSAARM